MRNRWQCRKEIKIREVKERDKTDELVERTGGRKLQACTA